MIIKKQSGAVSLFIVIFSSVLIALLAVSFTRIMIADQQQATSIDLSASAYDSALAGVEDAKRALLKYQTICNSSSTADCDTAKNAIDSSTNSSLICNEATSTLQDVVVNSQNEVPVTTSSSSSDLNQAYTCVKINLQTPDYLGLLTTNESALIPIKGVSSINRIKIEWFSTKDISSTFNSSISLPTVDTALLSQGLWPANRPALLRTQVMNLNGDAGGFKLSDLDNNGSTTYSNTLFLYPSSNGSSALSFTANDPRRIYLSSARPSYVLCSSSVASVTYSCSVTLTLPGTISTNDIAYLRVASIYNKTNYKVTLMNNATTVNFDGVQPEIDSTGRADNLIRRVSTRVESSNVNFPYPEAAVDISGGLCKDFWVTDRTADYGTTGNCTP